MNENVIVNIIERLAALESQVANLMLDAVVAKVHENENLLDVAISEQITLEKVPYYTQRAGDGKVYWMPSVGESGTVLIPSGDVENAKFLVGVTTDANPAPEKDKNIYIRQWKDGYKETFDGNDNTHLLSIGSNTERKTTKTQIQDKVATTTRTTEATQIEDAVGAVKITIGPAGITLTGLVNVVGVLQVGGIPMTVP